MKESPPEGAMAETRRLAAIMFTDIVGFSRQMGADEAHTLQLLTVHNQRSSSRPWLRITATSSRPSVMPSW